ncbi:hypothetical protein PV325_003826 [Microctonus aethiopoides]|nr:hypothetical protein PV325_003826 [Microctonus aethiopoides]
MLALAMRREHTSGRSSNYEPGNPLTGFEPLQQTSFVHQVNESRIRGDGQINDDGELQEYVDIAQVQQLLQQQTQHQQHHHQQQTTTACLWGGVYPPPPPPPTIGYPHHHHHHHHHHTPSHQSVTSIDACLSSPMVSLCFSAQTECTELVSSEYT